MCVWNERQGHQHSYKGVSPFIFTVGLLKAKDLTLAGAPQAECPQVGVLSAVEH